jgi:hypothetical protein
MADGRTIGTMGLVLSRFIDQITTSYPVTNCVYDEQLTVESALTKLRARYNQEGITDRSEFPMFAFNRSELKWFKDGIGKRSVTLRAFDRPTEENPELIIRKAAQASFDVNFLYLSNDAESQEIFEVDYLGEDAFSDVKTIVVDIPDLGEFNYYVQYSNLISKAMSSKDIYYKTVTGKATVLGWFFSVRGTGKWITEIEAKIKTFNDAVMSNISIPAS